MVRSFQVSSVYAQMLCNTLVNVRYRSYMFRTTSPVVGLRLRAIVE